MKKLKIKLPHLRFRTITSALFLIIVAAEIAITLNYLYKNLQPAAAPVDNTKIISADLKGYANIYNDLTSRQTYVPLDFSFQNPNPFKFGQ